MIISKLKEMLYFESIQYHNFFENNVGLIYNFYVKESKLDEMGHANNALN